MTNVAMLSTVADLSATVTAQGISPLVPAGVVMPYAGATAPTGWLLCEGAAISRTTYADLFAAISTAHGSGDGSTTFNLPDYRARFLRGRANSSANDADRALRTAAATGGNTGDAVGSVQSFATSKATGNTNKSTSGLTATASSSSVTGSTTGSSLTITANNQNKSNQAFSTFGATGYNSGDNNADVTSHTHTLSGATAAAQTITIGAGDNETRPINAYVNYIIKI